MADPLLLSLAAGCALLTVDTQVEVADGVVVERTRAEVRSEGTCHRVDVVVPPSVVVADRAAKTRLSDDTGHRLGDARWEVVPRDVRGVGHQVLHVPELLRGDAVRIDIERHWTARDYTWSPGRDGARWAEIRLPLDATTMLLGKLDGQRRQRWVAEPTAADGIFIAGPRPATAPAPAAAALTPAEAFSRVSSWTLLPTRPDLPLELSDPTVVGAATSAQVAQALVAWTSQGPTPLRLGRILPQGTPVAPGQPLEPVAATIDGDVARLWAHPDQRWSPEWRVLVDGRVLDAVAGPAGHGPSGAASATLARSLELRLPEGGSPQVELVPGRGSTALQVDRWQLADASSARARVVEVPPGARLLGAQVEGGTHSRAVANTAGDQVFLLAAESEDPVFVVTMELPDAPTCGERRSTDDVELVDLRVSGDGAQITQAGRWWRLHSWNDVPLLSERARLIAGLHGRFNRRSIPEPGLPLRLRSRLDGWGLAAEMASALRNRASIEPLPGDPRWPRKLMKARRSGVVTPVEAALIVRAYALQSKMEADWALVRPASEGPGDSLCPLGHDEGLVRIQLDGETRWIDPGCTACAPFEIRPELLGASAIGPWLETTPDPPPGASRVTVTDDSTVTWTLSGPAALELRRWLEDIPLDARETRLAERLAGKSATLSSATGVAEAGADIVVVATAVGADAIPEPADLLLPEPRPDGSAFLAWPGPREYTWAAAGSEPVHVGIDGLTRALSADQVARTRASLRRPYEPESEPPPGTADSQE